MQSLPAPIDQLFEVAFNNAASGMAVTDQAGNILKINNFLCEFLGYTQAELVGQSINVIAHPAERAVFLSYRERLQEGDAFHLERRLLHKDGHEEWALHTVSRVAGGEFYFSQIQDITEFKRVEEELRRSEERLRLAFSALAEGLIISYADGTVHMNASARRILTPPEGAASIPAVLYDQRGEMIAPEMQPTAYTLRTGQPLVNAVVGLQSGNEMKWLLTNTRPIKDPQSGIVRGVVTSFSDITEKRQTEAQLERLGEQLRHSQRMESVGRLAGGIAHDFNNLLTAILGEASVRLMDGAMPPHVSKSFEIISASARRGAALTNKLLTFSRMQVADLRRVDLGVVVRGIEDVLRRLLSGRVACEISGRGSCIVFADVNMLEQVVINLAVNANDAMPEGGRLFVHTELREISALDCREHRDRRAGRFVCLTVRDTGAGMSPETIERIFEPYFTTKPAGKGTGLGLAIVYGIVRQHGGWLEVKSESGAGTEFSVYLPESTAPVSQRPEAMPLRKPVLSRGQGQGILVVEDDFDIRALLRTVLTTDGFRVFMARSGAQALDVFAQERANITLVLTDVLLEPEMNGYEVAERIRALAPDVRILFASGYREKSPPEGIVLVEGENFLMKPYEIPVLIDTVRRQFL